MPKGQDRPPPKMQKPDTPRRRKARELLERSRLRAQRVSEDRAAQVDPDRARIPLKVRATKLGYFAHKRRRPGDVFLLPDSDYQFSQRWMEEVPDATPESITTGQDELQRKREEAHTASRPPTGDESPL